MRPAERWKAHVWSRTKDGSLPETRKAAAQGTFSFNAERNRNANGSSVQSLTLENDNVCLWLF